MEINGIPLHPLVVHAVVVFLPLAVAGAVAWAARPPWAWWLRWVTLATTVMAAGALVVARLSGASLRDQKYALLGKDSPLGLLIQAHERRAFGLTLATLVFLVVVVAAWVALPATTALASGRGTTTGRGPAGLVPTLRVLLVVVGLVVVVFTVLTGDSGAHAVWS